MNNTVNLSGQPSFIASIPIIVGFHPRESFLVVGLLRTPDNRALLGTIARLDLDAFTANPAGTTQQVLDAMTNQETAKILGIVVTATPSDGHVLPLRIEVDTFHAVCGAADHSLVQVVHVPNFEPGSPWASYCHVRCRGVLPDTSVSELAATMAAEGREVLPDVEDLTRLFAPGPAAAIERIAPMVATATTAIRDELARGDIAALGTRLRQVDAAAAAATQGTLPDNDEQIAELVAAFASDAIGLAILVPPDETQPAATELLHHLVTFAPPANAAAITGALAATYYLLGDSHRAWRAANAAPFRSMLSRVIVGILQTGMPHEKAVAFLTEESAEQRSALTDGSSS